MRVTPRRTAISRGVAPPTRRLEGGAGDGGAGDEEQRAEDVEEERDVLGVHRCLICEGKSRPR